MIRKQTHIRIYEADKKVLDLLMKKKRIRTQADAVHKMLMISMKKRRRRK